MEIKTLVEHIRESSRKGRLIKKSELEREPISLKGSHIDNFLEELKKSEEISDINVLNGEKEIYLYSKEYLSDGYRDLLFNLEERKIEDVVVEIVRNESKIYPRPTSIEIFKLAPFNTIDLDMNIVLENVLKNGDTDIKIIKASNGVKYLYSEKYMTLGHARGLCEWIEVGQFQNP